MQKQQIYFAFGFLLATLSGQALADHPLTHIEVENLARPPIVDGIGDEWKSNRVHLHPDGRPHAHDHEAEAKTLLSYVTTPEDMALNGDWKPLPQVRAGVYGDRIYLLVRWRDERADEIYKPWKRFGPRWRRGRNLDDMLALRFELGDSFDNCMLSGTEYEVDVWRWSAGRSNQVGHADDMHHAFSPNPIENAAVYDLTDKVIYIRKTSDSGDHGWSIHPRPKGTQEKVVIGIDIKGPPSGSVADVQAKGLWKDGVWTVELSRKLQTDDPTDAVFRKGGRITGQMAFFNAGYRMRKQVTEPLTFDLSKLK